MYIYFSEFKFVIYCRLNLLKVNSNFAYLELPRESQLIWLPS